MKRFLSKLGMYNTDDVQTGNNDIQTEVGDSVESSSDLNALVQLSKSSNPKSNKLLDPELEDVKRKYALFIGEQLSLISEANRLAWNLDAEGQRASGRDS